MEFVQDPRERREKTGEEEMQKSDAVVGNIRISIRTSINISAGTYFGSVSFSILMSCIYFKRGLSH